MLEPPRRELSDGAQPMPSACACACPRACQASFATERHVTSKPPRPGGLQVHEGRQRDARCVQQHESIHRAAVDASSGSIPALSRHRRRHVHCAGVGVPVLLRGSHFEYRHAHTRAMGMPSAMPRWKKKPIHISTRLHTLFMAHFISIFQEYYCRN